MLFTLANRGSDRLNLTKIEVKDSVGGTTTMFTGVSAFVYFNAGEEKTIAKNTDATAPFSNQCLGMTAGTVFDYSTVTFTYSQGGITGIKQTGARPLVGRCS